jgi:hypothetical protein
MPGALIVDGGVATIGAGPVLTTVTAGSSSTFTIRNAAFTAGIVLTDLWHQASHAGQIRVTSPNLVPVTNGIRIQVPTGLADFLMPGPPWQPLIPQDILTVSSNGTAADVNLACIQTYYDDLPGGNMTLRMPGDVLAAAEYIFGWPVAATSSGTAGNQNTTVITTTVDSSSANAWYAVLGYQVDSAIGAVGISGVDTSNLFIGGPGDTAGRRTRNYFADLSMRLGKPCVPLFNAANKGNTNLVLIDHGTSTSVNATLLVAQLPPNYM